MAFSDDSGADLESLADDRLGCAPPLVLAPLPCRLRRALSRRTRPSPTMGRRHLRRPPMMTPRESDPTVYRPRKASAAAGAAAGPDAQSPLVLAPGHGRALRVDRPGRVGRVRGRPGGDAQL